MTVNPTTDGLLAALQRHTKQPGLPWATPPVALTGGFWAEMYIIELATHAPTELHGRLVARVMPDPATAAHEAAMQRHLARSGFPVPQIRCAGQPSDDLARAWTIMDLAPGQPLLAGLSATAAIRQAPILLRRLPDLLAEAAATLHQCPLDGLDDEHAGAAPTIHDFLQRIATQAGKIGRRDLADAASTLDRVTHDAPVICHGDLHPFNLLVDHERWTLIDWSTAVVADRHYDLAFTTLMLSNPPLGGPAPVRALARVIGTRLANRFIRTYTQRTGQTLDTERLDWGRRALVEVATWEANDEIAAHHGHPWLAMRSQLEAALT